VDAQAAVRSAVSYRADDRDELLKPRSYRASRVARTSAARPTAFPMTGGFKKLVARAMGMAMAQQSRR
jgi:hypothetical protein